MKKRINDYTFNAASQQVTLTGITVDIDSLLLITNLADNIIIYNFADATKTATAAGSVITLAYDTSSMSNGDPLQIFYDDAAEYPLTDGELRAIPVPVSGTFYQATQPVSGPLTNTELRAADVPITLDGESVAVTGPLTDTQLRATAVPVSGSFYPATQPVSASSLPLPTGASTESSLLNVITSLGNLLTELQLKADLSETQPVSAAALPLPTGAATETSLTGVITALGNLLTELQLKANLSETQPVSGPVTNTELRASDVNVSLDGETVNTADANVLAQLQTLNTNDATFMLRYLVSVLSDPVYLNKVSNALNVLLLSGSTTAVTGTLTGVTTLSNITNIGGNGADKAIESFYNISWHGLREMLS